MDKRVICKAVGVGFERALERYLHWNSFDTIRRNLVESVALTSVAEALGEALEMAGEGPYLTLEQTFSEIVDWAAAKTKVGRKSALEQGINGKPNGRVDIVLWNKSWQPRVAIEIKTGIAIAPLRADAERVIGFAKHLGRLTEGSMRYGIVGTTYWYARSSGAEKAEAALEEEMQMLAGKHGVQMSGGPIGSRALREQDCGASVFLFSVPR